MRSVNKGIAPKNYTHYRQAKDDLRAVLGEYCSYCEMNISNGMDIEHVSPKRKDPDLSADWDNLLVACKVCNRLKSAINDDRQGYVFPDTHNTAYAFTYTKSSVRVNSLLHEDEKQLAQATLDLVQINRRFDSAQRNDDRLVQRLREWDKAIESLNDYISNPSIEMIRQIGQSHSGFISSWLEVFKDYPVVKEVLLSSLEGTAYECYDINFNAINTLNRK